MNDENDEKEPSSLIGMIITIGIAVIMLVSLVYVGNYLNKQIAREIADGEGFKEIEDAFGSLETFVFAVLIIGTPLVIMGSALLLIKKKEEEKVKYIDTEKIKYEVGDVVNGTDAYHPSWRCK